MKLRIGFELDYDFPQPTPVILMLNVHFSRVSDLAEPDHIRIQPSVRVSAYRDSFGNWCTRLLAPQGLMRIAADAIISDSGLPESHDLNAGQIPVEQLPEESLVFLLASRFCDSDRLLDLAWQLFGHTRPGAARVQAICDFVNQRIAFNYNDASVTRTATDAYREGRGVCRDYAHLAIAFCRAMNIPARYCTCYLGDAGTPPPYPPGDFAASLEAYLEGGWQTFDPRNNVPRIGRVLIARGRDAADVAIATTFGPNTLKGFKVWTDEVVERTT
ncbi:transglutaminase [Bosea sp. Root381]|uniref:transglutaminase-like domain-containing protein n=1 Tax=Bosea sp. Root381 TaxID=1736524 RepID=UPI0006F43AB1|nr:transglutaminase family protein [Bosea sp. Root381]KRE04947.1 transglutaminase [Bosea sp. Root381]